MYEVVEVSLSSLVPMLDVVAVGPRCRDRAAGKPATLIAAMHRQAQPRWDQTVNPADVDGKAIALGHCHDVRITEAANYLCWEPGSVLDAGAPAGGRAAEHIGVDVHDYLRCRSNHRP